MYVGSAGEDGLVEDELGKGAAQTPNIDGLIVVFRAVDDLGGSVETSSHIAGFVILWLTAGGWVFFYVFEWPWDAKISKFERTIGHEVYIARFDITMHISLPVHMVKCLH